MEKVLITGGSGFIGSQLIPFLQSKGKSVSNLGRSLVKDVPSYIWDVDKKQLDESALKDKDVIIHLAGAGIADKRWTKKYKKEIVDSRIKSAELLFEKIKSSTNNITTFISASAIGYYGETGSVWAEEGFHSPEDFLGTTCIEWEKAARKFETIGIRVVIFRFGIILSDHGGALPTLALPVKFFIGSPLGSGNQYMSWIHINDLCRLLLFAIDNKKINGVYNAVAPGPVTNKSFMKSVGKALQRPVLPIAVPEFILRLILGEKADIVVKGQRVSNEKIRLTGFNFNHTDLDKTLGELL